MQIKHVHICITDMDARNRNHTISLPLFLSTMHKHMHIHTHLERETDRQTDRDGKKVDKALWLRSHSKN